MGNAHISIFSGVTYFLNMCCGAGQGRGDGEAVFQGSPHEKEREKRRKRKFLLVLCCGLQDKSLTGGRLSLEVGEATRPWQGRGWGWASGKDFALTVNETTGIGPIATYFPTLTVDLCDIVGESWNPSPQEPFPGYGCQHPGWWVKTQGHDFYVCPGHSRGRSEVQKCGGPQKDTVRPGVVKQQEMPTGTPLRPGI